MKRRNLLKILFFTPIVSFLGLNKSEAKLKIVNAEPIRVKQESYLRGYGCSLEGCERLVLDISKEINKRIVEETGVFMNPDFKCDAKTLCSSVDVNLKHIRHSRTDIFERAIDTYIDNFCKKIKELGIKECSVLQHFYDPTIHRQFKWGMYGFLDYNV